MRETIRLTMGQAIVKFLDNQYVEFDGMESRFVNKMFGVFGHGCVLGIGQALEEHRGGITLYQGKNEQGQALAAMAYAKQKNRLEIIPCTSSIGPGALNMVTACGCASVNRIPLLVFPGDTYACRQPDPVLQQVEHPHSIAITANDAFQAVTRYWDRVTRPEQVMTALLNAMRVLTDPADTGAVAICLPQDVQGEAYDYPLVFFEKRVHHIERRAPTTGEIIRAAQLITGKKKPLLICGGGVRYSRAGEVLRRFAEEFRIPIGETQAGKGEVPWKHSMNLGGIGATGNLAANTIARDADLIIAVGSRLSDFTTSSKWLFQNPQVEFLGINVNSFDAAKTDARVVVADAKTTLEALEAALLKNGYCSAYTGEITAAKAAWDAECERLYCAQRDDGIAQTRVVGELNQHIAKDAVVVGSSGSLPGDLQRCWRSEVPGTYHMEYGFSCMGYEITGAVGVKMAEPDREVYALVGDGSFIMLHSELVTALQEGIKVNVILMDNHGFQCIRNLQNSQGIPTFGTEFRYREEETDRLTGDYMPIDFAKIAEGYGCKAYAPRTVEEFIAALEDSKKQKVSTLIDIKVLPKSMTGDYGSWWRVGTPQVAQSEAVRKASENLEEHIQQTRPY